MKKKWSREFDANDFFGPFFHLRRPSRSDYSQVIRIEKIIDQLLLTEFTAIPLRIKARVVYRKKIRTVAAFVKFREDRSMPDTINIYEDIITDPYLDDNAIRELLRHELLHIETGYCDCNFLFQREAHLRGIIHYPVDSKYCKNCGGRMNFYRPFRPAAKTDSPVTPSPQPEETPAQIS